MDKNHEKIDSGNVRDILQHLIETCRDGQNGHRFAAEHATSPELKKFFNEESLRRGQAAGELESAVERLGEHDPKREGTTQGSLHRAWFELKSKLGAGDDQGVLNWMEQGEDHAKKQFKEALKEKLPNDVREVVQRVSQEVIGSHDKVRDMRDRFKSAA
jgi:uncharacterized protein (TIGR02284 family)